MSDRRPTFHWPPEWTVPDLIVEAQKLIAENKRTLMWRTASRLSMAARGVVFEVRAEDSRPQVVDLARRLAEEQLLSTNDAAFIFYCYAIQVESVDLNPLRAQLESDDPFRKYNAALFLAWRTPPDPAAIPILDEELSFNPEADRFAQARARYRED